MEAIIEITGCHKVELWYKHRVGDKLTAVVKNGVAFVNNNPIFKIRQSDYTIVNNIKKNIPHKTRYSVVLKILEERDMTADEINVEYQKINGRPDKDFVRNMIGFLLRAKKIKVTGERRTGRNGYRNNVVTLITE